MAGAERGRGGGARGRGRGRAGGRGAGRGDAQAQAGEKKQRSIKNQIRGLQRLLAKGHLEKKAQKKVEAHLEALLMSQQRHEKAEREREMAVKYHKVKFFERVKVERRIKKITKELESLTQGSSEAKDASKRLKRAKSDLTYILHFPAGKPYISIIKEPADEKEREKREDLRREALAAARDAAMVNEADEGAAGQRADARKAKEQRRTASQDDEDGMGAAPADAGSDSEGSDDFFLDSPRGDSGGEQQDTPGRGSDASSSSPSEDSSSEATSGPEGAEEPQGSDGAPPSSASTSTSEEDEDSAGGGRGGASGTSSSSGGSESDGDGPGGGVVVKKINRVRDPKTGKMVTQERLRELEAVREKKRKILEAAGVDVSAREVPRRPPKSRKVGAGGARGAPRGAAAGAEAGARAEGEAEGRARTRAEGGRKRRKKKN
ncbi:unnamed protein product [Pedinophyceae sp. YPF-701]|nr:unnamed protein product [Pedinophyceae sp. YPF-701]